MLLQAEPKRLIGDSRKEQAGQGPGPGGEVHTMDPRRCIAHRGVQGCAGCGLKRGGDTEFEELSKKNNKVICSQLYI